MTDASQLPSGYEPYPELVVSSNRLVRVDVLVAVNDQPAVLIGRGQVPRIWIAAPISPSHDEWAFVVRDNTAISPIVDIRTDKGRGATDIRVSGRHALSARAVNAETASIDFIDLRQFGLAIWGDAKALHIAGSTLVGNHFERVGTAFAIRTNTPGADPASPSDR
jgi:hypothetical protein